MNWKHRVGAYILAALSLVVAGTTAATNDPPTMIAPRNGALLLAGPTELYARTSVRAESIEFFANNLSLGRGFASGGLNTVKLTWPDAQPGEYDIVAVARDLSFSGINRTSAAVHVQVVAAPEVNSSFALWFFDRTAVDTSSRRPFLRSYTVNSGASDGGLLLPKTRLLIPPTTSAYWYGSWAGQAWRVHFSTGNAEPLLPTGIEPPIGSVSAISFDVNRGRLLVLGSGGLYRYTPKWGSGSPNGTWEFVTKLPDRGLVRGMLYHTAERSIYILDHDGQTMSRYDSNGSFISSFTFPLVPVRDNLRMELVSVRDKIVVLSETVPTAPGSIIQSFIQIVSPSRQDVRLSYVTARVNDASITTSTLDGPNIPTGLSPAESSGTNLAAHVTISHENGSVLLKQSSMGVLEENTSLRSPIWTPVGLTDNKFRIPINPDEPSHFFRTRLDR